MMGMSQRQKNKTKAMWQLIIEKVGYFPSYHQKFN
jgi:hypothetical protein